jgi:hypothetical protein
MLPFNESVLLIVVLPCLTAELSEYQLVIALHTEYVVNVLL